VLAEFSLLAALIGWADPLEQSDLDKRGVQTLKEDLAYL
jgi:hypothetical protein